MEKWPSHHRQTKEVCKYQKKEVKFGPNVQSRNRHPDVCISCHRLRHDFADCPIKPIEIPPLPTPEPSSSHHHVIEHPAPPERTTVTCEKCIQTGHTKEECIFSGPIICSYCRGMGHPKPKCRFILDRGFTWRFTSQELLALHAKAQGKVWNAKDYIGG